ncbi:helix-turn-helix domain-containing protein [Psychrobacillus sp. FSL K6-1267]|uniref:helix-turn-helix domain-containing protein n=1 Tax=Psychrobacillus sp. FSL K6-1267 TaxID=2921543 RepID=UPI0030FC2E07
MRESRSVNPNFGNLVKHLRRKRSMSLRQMTEATGISESYINRIENGFRICPSFPVIEKLATVLGVTPNLLLEVSSNNQESVVLLEELLYTNDFTLNGVKSVSPGTKELILNLLDLVNDVSWDKDTIIADIYEVIQVVNDLKQELSV